MPNEHPISEHQLLARYELEFYLDEMQQDMVFCAKIAGVTGALGGVALELSAAVGSNDGLPSASGELYLAYGGVLSLGIGALVLVSGYQKLRQYNRAAKQAEERDY